MSDLVFRDDYNLSHPPTQGRVPSQWLRACIHVCTCGGLSQQWLCGDSVWLWAAVWPPFKQDNWRLSVQSGNLPSVFIQCKWASMCPKCVLMCVGFFCTCHHVKAHLRSNLTNIKTLSVWVHTRGVSEWRKDPQTIEFEGFFVIKWRTALMSWIMEFYKDHVLLAGNFQRWPCVSSAHLN